MKKSDKQLLNNLNANPNTKKMFKRQQKLDTLDHIAQNQRQNLIYMLIGYVFLAICIIITALLWHYYMIPYWKQIDVSKVDNWENGWNQFKAFFLIHKDLGATFGIVFCVFSVLLVSYELINTIKLFFKCLTNLWVFKRNFFFWLLLTLFAWIPVLNIFIILLAMHKYTTYTKLKIANQAQLSSTYTINQLNQNVPQPIQQPMPQYNQAPMPLQNSQQYYYAQPQNNQK